MCEFGGVWSAGCFREKDSAWESGMQSVLGLLLSFLIPAQWALKLKALSFNLMQVEFLKGFAMLI